MGKNIVAIATRALLSIIFGVCTVVLAAIWIRSYVVVDLIREGGADGNEIHLRSIKGAVYIITFRQEDPLFIRDDWLKYDHDDPIFFEEHPGYRWIPLRFYTKITKQQHMGPPRRVFVLSYWLVVSLLATFTGRLLLGLIWAWKAGILPREGFPVTMSNGPSKHS
jgi:hypothetical protein